MPTNTPPPTRLRSVIELRWQNLHDAVMKAISLAMVFWAGCSSLVLAHDASKPKTEAHRGGPKGAGKNAVCRLHIELKDADTGAAIPGMMPLAADDGRQIAPAVGEHGRGILRERGYSDDAIDALIADAALLE